MGEVWQFIVVLLCLFIVSGLSYMAGRDAAEREAAYTIANLRRSNRVLRSELDVQALHKCHRP